MSDSPAPPDKSAPTPGYDETAAPVAGKTSNDVVHDEKPDSLEEALPSELVSAGSQHLQRRLGGKEVQLIALGGAIGTCKTPFRIQLPTISDGCARHHSWFEQGRPDVLIDRNLAALFVQMGGALPKGGPAGLFLGFCIYGTVMVCVNQCFGTSLNLSPSQLAKSF